MSSSSPPAILPITATNIQPPLQSSTAIESQPPIATPAFRSFINNISSAIHNGFAQRRPWMELIDRSAFSRPESFSDALARFRKNYSYFRVNYLSLLAATVAFSLITNPFSLLLLASLLASWLFLYLFRPSDQPLVVFGRTFSNRETLGILVVVSIIVIFLTSVGSVLISAIMAGMAIVFLHGAFRAPEDLFLDEQDGASTGFLSFLGGATSNVAAAAAPIVASQV